MKSEREHVGPFLGNHPELFKLGGLQLFEGLSHHRWTVDEPRDYALLQLIYDLLDSPDRIFLSNDILDLMETEPALMEINSGIMRNEGYAKSLKEDEAVR